MGAFMETYSAVISLAKLPTATPIGRVVAEAGGVDAHRPAGLPQAVKGNPGQARRSPRNSVPLLVVKDEILDGVVGHDDVHPAVMIEIDGGESQRLGHRHTRGRIHDLHPDIAGDVGELSVTVVAIDVGETHLRNASGGP